MLLRFAAAVLLLAAIPAFAADRKTERVIIVTVDGLRQEELFGGLDPALLAEPKETGIQDLDALKETYWRETPEARREAIFPFIWGTLVHEGVLLGDPAKNSRVRVGNGLFFSYPGYSEILAGSHHPDVKSNDLMPNPQTTVLEFVQSEMKLPYTGVAAFCSWSIFNGIVAKADDPFYCNAGYEAVPEELLTEPMKVWNEAQFDMLTPWNAVRFDKVTFELALAFLDEYEPTLMLLGLGETDDWAHNRRYDRVIEAARYFDDAMERLWTFIQSHPAYKDKTTVIVTSDHGRGPNLAGWHSHGVMHRGSEYIWLGVFGPDTPKSGVLGDTGETTQGQVAATAAHFLGLDFNAFAPNADPVLKQAVAP